MTRFLVVAGVIGAAVLAALFIAPVVIDWNGYRGSFAAELSRATGRTVALDGPIEVTFLPSPRILANNVRLSGPKDGDGSADSDLLRLRAVELQVGLLPLLTGHIVVERLTMVRPEILVETDDAGQVRWVMDGANGETLPDIALKRFAISDGTLVWRDRDHGVQARIENISMNLAADSLSGPAKMNGRAQIGAVPVRFTMNIGQVRESASTPFNLTFEAPDLHAKGEFVGQFMPSGQRLTGRIKASGDDARAVLAALIGPTAGQGIGAALIAHPFGLEGRVSASTQLVEANDVIVNLADQRATGALRARVDDSHHTAIEAKFSMPRLDLDGLATVPPIAAKDDARALLPHDLNVKLDFSADAVLAAGKALQGVVLKAALGDGSIALDQFDAQLPGAGSFRISGSLAGRDRLAFDGTLAAKAANLRDLLSWLQIDTSSVPSGRLAGAALTAKLSADSDRAELSNVDLRVDTTRAHGTLRLDYRDRVGFHLDLAADRLDLDAYQESDVATPATVPVVISSTSAPEILSGLSGDGRFAIGRLTYRGIDLRTVDLAATIANGQFTVAGLSAQPSDPGEFQVRDTSDSSGLAAADAPAPSVESLPPPATAAPLPTPVAEKPPAPKDDRDGFVRGILKMIGD